MRESEDPIPTDADMLLLIAHLFDGIALFHIKRCFPPRLILSFLILFGAR
jgi:hypothetical protein